MPAKPDNPVLLYVSDPMCAWCYGFTPVLRRLQALWRGRLNLRVLMAGLHPYAKEPLTPEQKQRLAVSWHQVQERTSLSFDYSLFLRPDFVYDTEPACRAVVSVRHLRPVLVLEVLRAFHSAFYADGQDITDPMVLARIVRMFGIPENLFFTLFEADEIIRETADEFELVKELGVRNYPSVLLETTEGIDLLVKGYADLDELEGRLLEQLQIRQS